MYSIGIEFFPHFFFLNYERHMSFTINLERFTFRDLYVASSIRVTNRQFDIDLALACQGELTSLESANISISYLGFHRARVYSFYSARVVTSGSPLPMICYNVFLNYCRERTSTV